VLLGTFARMSVISLIRDEGGLAVLVKCNASAKHVTQLADH